MKKRTIVLLGLITLAAVWTACGKNGEKDSEAKTRTLQEIRDSKEIVIGVFSDKKPFGYVDENGTYQGYDVYFGRRLAKDLGAKVKYVPVEAASRVEYLRSGKVDLILANFTVTDERKEQVDFALPYMKVSLGVVSPEDQLITKESQLDGKTLIVSKGTTAEAYFMKNRPEVKLLKFDQYSEAFQALKDGRGDALATDNTEVLAWAIENEGFKVGIESLGNTDVIAPAVQKGNEELLSWLNEEIKTLGEEQFFHENYEKTLKPVYGESADPENLVVEGGEVE